MTPTVSFAQSSAVGADAADGAVAASNAGLSALGLELYRRQYCGLCHALEKATTAGIFGPTHNGMAEIAAERLLDKNYQGSARTVAEYLRESITQPDVYVVPGFEATVHRMPAYTQLKPEEVDAIVHFLLAQEECAVDECTDSEVEIKDVPATPSDSVR